MEDRDVRLERLKRTSTITYYYYYGAVVECPEGSEPKKAFSRRGFL